MDILIRDLTESDLAIVNEIGMAAFQSTEDRTDELRRLFALRPELWLLALAQGVPVGAVLAVDYGPFAYVGDMVVRPSMQHHGIGSRLMKELLGGLDARGTPMVLLDASKAGAPMYRRLGFVESDGSYVFEQVAKSPPVPLPPNVHPFKPEDAAALVDWDASFFGANRARVLLPLLAEFPDRAWVVKDETGSWSGYLFAQPKRLGPWVARQLQDAQALLQVGLSVPFTGAPRVTVPQMNGMAVELLERFGFRLVDNTQLHMRRGGTGLVSRREMIFGQRSFSLG